ncbi:MAG: alpha/beta hydrolase [Bacteroidia bacterium]|nr:alpha/beta hydrolase [Bacteroidia bacterium]
MKLILKLCGCLLLCLVLISCQKDISTNLAVQEPLKINPSITPLWIDNQNVLFFENVCYGESQRNLLDILIPTSGKPAAIAIYIHGGGFTSGDKSIALADSSFRRTIRELLKNNIAFASINYSYIDNSESEGVLSSLKDCKRALQFLRYYAPYFHLNKEKVALIGSSAGGGAALWLGLNEDMAKPNDPNPINQQSTRVQSVLCTDAQSNYDLLQWHNLVFAEFKMAGFSFKTVKNLVTVPRLLKFYGVDTMEELYTIAMWTKRTKLNMLLQITVDDPELYITSNKMWSTYPITMNQLLHHPYHSKALKDKADVEGVHGKYFIPSLGIDTRDGESMDQFIIRKLM